MTQPVPKVSPDDVRRVIKRDFPSEDGDLIIEMLNAYSHDNLVIDRVHLAILKLSAGDTDRLLEVLEIARQDFRDVIAPAEYPAYSQVSPSRRLELTEEEKAEIFQKDWDQYQDWLQN